MTANPYHKPAIAIWIEYYRSRTGETYLMDGKQAASMKHLLKKIDAKVRERGLEVNEYTILNSLKGFLYSIQDKWILDNLDISLVNSKFNSLYVAAIKTSPLGANRLNDLIEQRFGSSSAG
jgi:hypothetical protein